MVLVLAGRDSNKVLFWLLGSFSASDWNKVAILSATTLIGFIWLLRRARPLTVYTSGEETALRLGVETEGLKWTILLLGTAMTAAAVSAVGIIGFVGLFVPHIARKLFGPDLRKTLPSAAIIGAGGMAAADVVAQRALPGQEINVGVITAIVGAPFLLSILKKV
jgi:iron complex transport system permease protein